MTGRRLISGLAGAWAIASPGATRVRLEGAAGAPRRLAASWLAALLGRAQLPGMGELAALRPPTRALLVGFSGWIVLVALVTLAAVVSVEMSAVSMPEWLGVPSSASRTAAARSPANFENIVQRPLFARSRQGTISGAGTAPTGAPAIAPHARPRRHIEGCVYQRVHRQSLPAVSAKSPRPMGSGRRGYCRLECRGRPA